MAAWSDGYFTDVQYTTQFFSELAPGYLAYACLRQGVRAPAMGPGSTYMELGCGQGLSLNLLAAANPQTTFYGFDFHPGQIDNARRLTSAAGLTNVAFDDLSFEQMLALPEDALPRCDIVAAHGILSWVGPKNRAQLVQLLDRFVKPGGLAYVSYNCLPGWAPRVPLQRFMAEYVARSTGDPEARVMAALKAATEMLEGGPGYFQSVPSLKARIEEAKGQKPAYLLHEYLNEHSIPFFHADIARELEGARLTYAASANIADDLVNLAATESLQQMIRDAQDETWRQTLLDYASNKGFRRDIFVRGRNALSRLEQDALLAETRFTLLTLPSPPYDFPIPLGMLRGQEAVYEPIMDALAEGPRTYAELAALPAFAGGPDTTVRQAVNLLFGGRRIHPLGAEEAAASAKAFNRALLERATFDENPVYLASGVGGTGVRVEFEEVLALKAIAEGDETVEGAARKGWEIMAKTGRRLVRDGQPLIDQAATETELAARIRRYHDGRLALHRRLGVI